MPKIKVAAFSISLDGYGAGPRQDIDNPLGVRGLELHNWFFTTEVFKKQPGVRAKIKVKIRTSESAASYPLFASFCSRARSTRCIWRCRRFC